MGEKIDIVKLHRSDYAAPKKPVEVTIKKARYLAIEGSGAPGSEAFTAKIGALYGAAYTIKMTRKFGGEQDYTVSKLEAQYWADDASADFAALPPDRWCWRLMIRTPEFVKKTELTRARKTLEERGKGDHVEEVELVSLSEGRCIQMLHLGPYEEEPRTIAVMRAFAEQEGLELHGIHHEIYLSDPRRVAPERLKTILRIPARRR